MIERNEKLYEFGQFRFDAEEKTLWQNGKNISLPPKILNLLCLLIERQGKIVTKDEIMDIVWADSFVEESNVKQSIYTLRQSLGAEAIETIPRRGYRFALPVQYSSAIELNPQFIKQSGISSYKMSLAVFGIIAGLLLLIGFLVNNSYLSKSKKSPIENISFQKLTFSGDVNFPVISPDGKSLAMMREGNLFLQDINTGSIIRVIVNEHNHFGNLQFSPNNENLYFRNEDRNNSGGDFFQVSRFGGNAKKIAENVWSGIGFSPDGRRIAFIRFYPNQAEWILMTQDIETGEEKKISTRKLPQSFYHSGFPAWSPDGKKISVVSQEKSGSALYLIGAENGQEERLETPRLTQIEQAAWLANGKAIVLAGREPNRFFQIWQYDLANGELQRITNDLNIYRNLSISADGNNLVVHQQTFYSHLWTASADNLDSQKQITFGNLNRDGNAGIAWTSDGGLVYASRIFGNVDLWLINPNNNSRQQLTKDAGAINESPFFSADQKFIYFESNRNGVRNIWRIEANGENPIQVSSTETETQFSPVVSPDNNWLYYLQKNSKGTIIYRKSTVDGKIEALTDPEKVFPDTSLSISPNGKLLAFFNLSEKREDSTENKTSQICIVSTESRSRPLCFKAPTNRKRIQWASDNKAIDYIENTAEGGKIWRLSSEENSQLQLILSIPKITIYDFLWSPDGKTLALARGKQETDAMLLKNFE